MNLIQCRMARGALDWSTRQLAAAAEVRISTVQKFQACQTVSADDLARMRSAFEKAGVIFVEENGEGLGMRLRKAR